MPDPWWALGMFTAGWVWALAVQWCDHRFRVRPRRRKPVREETDGGVLTFARKLTEEDMSRFRAEWQRRYGTRQTGEEESGA